MNTLRNALQNISFSIFGGTIIYYYGQDLKNLITFYYKSLLNNFYVEITIDREKSNMSFAILEYVYEQLRETLTQKQLDDGPCNYTLTNNTYNLKIKSDKSDKSVNILIGDKEITLYNRVDILSWYDNRQLEYQSQMRILESVIDTIYRAKQDPGKYIINFSLSDNGTWGSPHIRDHRIIKNMTIEMTKVVDAAKTFMKPETKEDYESRGIPYRYGLLLSGISGSGKTTVVEKIAMELEMSIYNINLISDRLTNGLLIEACISVLKRSLIIFDEFDKAYKQIIKNDKSKVTLAGILSAIDGTIRLPEGCIVIIIMNEKLADLISDKLERDALKRPGRIDKEIEFDKLYLL
jgi:hypothetical protein